MENSFVKQKVVLKSIKEVLKHLDEGLFAVPKLQRRFVWDGRRSAQLLDSMNRGMPIGSLMVWRTTRRHEVLLRTDATLLPPYKDHQKEIWFLIDGQQRLSSISKARSGGKTINDQNKLVDFGKLVYSYKSYKSIGITSLTDVAHSRFAYRTPHPSHDVTVQELLSNRKNSPFWHHFKSTRRDSLFSVQDRILSYKIPIVFIDTKQLEDVREIFLRINSGMTVNTADRLFARASKLDLREKMEELLKSLTDFSRLEPGTFLQTFAFLKNPQGRDVGGKAWEAWLTKFEEEVTNCASQTKQFLKDWVKFKVSAERAARFLKDQFGVRGEAMLPSGYMMGALIVFFWHHNQQRPTPSQLSFIRPWFWFTALGSRYTAAGLKPFINDCGEFIRLATVRSSLKFKTEAKIDPRRINDTSYGRRDSSVLRAFLCLMEANKPRDLESGAEIPINEFGAVPDRKNLHHIFARHQLKDSFPQSSYNSICNICLLAASQNKSFGSKLPRKYLAQLQGKKLLAKAMKSHLIPYKPSAAIWQRGHVRSVFKQFKKERLDCLCVAFARAAGLPKNNLFAAE